MRKTSQNRARTLIVIGAAMAAAGLSAPAAQALSGPTPATRALSVLPEPGDAGPLLDLQGARWTQMPTDC